MAHRLRKVSLWSFTGFYFLCWEVMKRLMPRPHWHVPMGEEVFGTLVTICLMFLTSVPWQWTGDARERTGNLRGMAQALVWNALWLTALAAVAFAVLPETRALQSTGMQIPYMTRWLPTESRMMIFNYPLALVFGWFVASQESTEANAKVSLELADHSRIQTLQAQLNPHTLFNVLSGLAELVHERADAAEETIVQLVELMRMLMQQSSALDLPLARERELITRFLEIMKLRLGPRLEVSWDWEPWVDALELPPFLIYPLVENAIKHGIAASRVGGTMRVEATRTGDRLLLLVADNGEPLKAGAPDGVGLSNLKERLQLLSRLKPELKLRQEGEWVTSRLSLAMPRPLREAVAEDEPARTFISAVSMKADSRESDSRTAARSRRTG